MTEDKILIQFIHETINSYRFLLNQYSINNKAIKKISNSLNHVLRQFDRVEYISESLLKEIIHKNLLKDKLKVFEMNWNHRKIIGGLYEHTTPIKILKNTLVEKCFKIEETEKYLEENAIICWITYDENNKLNQKYKSSRDKGWKSCYHECDIKPLSRTDVLNY